MAVGQPGTFVPVVASILVDVESALSTSPSARTVSGYPPRSPTVAANGHQMTGSYSTMSTSPIARKEPDVTPTASAQQSTRQRIPDRDRETRLPPSNYTRTCNTLLPFDWQAVCVQSMAKTGSVVERRPRRVHPAGSHPPRSRDLRPREGKVRRLHSVLRTSGAWGCRAVRPVGRCEPCSRGSGVRLQHCLGTAARETWCVQPLGKRRRHARVAVIPACYHDEYGCLIRRQDTDHGGFIVRGKRYRVRDRDQRLPMTGVVLGASFRVRANYSS